MAFITNMLGEVLKRDVTMSGGSTVAPHDLHYYLIGTAIADVSNNGTSKTDYVTSIASHTASAGYGPFRDGAKEASPYADFDQNYDPINGLDAGVGGSNYTVRTGDTLRNIAQSLWGDASLWYIIAQANGLNADSVLQTGQVLVIPNNKVQNVHNSASTFKVYDPNVGAGDNAPTLREVPKPPPPPQPQRSGGGCGFIGKLLVAVVAVAVTVLTYGAMGGFTAGALSGWTAVGAGAISGVAGNVAGQVVGLATGVQSRFDWGGVATSALSGAVGAAAGLNGFVKGGVLSSWGSVEGAIARGVIGSVMTQGVGVATGLQNHFDWTGVAAAGVSAGVGTWAAGKIDYDPGLRGDFANDLRGGAITGSMLIANAATRSLISGTDFGDNLIAGLPDVIGQTIGNMVAGAVTQPPRERPETIRKTPMEIMQERTKEWEEGVKNQLADTFRIEAPSQSWVDQSEVVPGFVIGPVNGTASGRTSEASFTLDNKKFVVYGASSMKDVISIRDDLADIFSTPRGGEMFATLEKRKGAIFGIDLTQRNVANADRQGLSNLIHIDLSFHPT